MSRKRGTKEFYKIDPVFYAEEARKKNIRDQESITEKWKSRLFACTHEDIRDILGKRDDDDDDVEDDKVEDDKVEDDKVEDDKVEDDKVEDDKVEDDKVEDEVEDEDDDKQLVDKVAEKIALFLANLHRSFLTRVNHMTLERCIHELYAMVIEMMEYYVTSVQTATNRATFLRRLDDRSVEFVTSHILILRDKRLDEITMRKNSAKKARTREATKAACEATYEQLQDTILTTMPESRNATERKVAGDPQVIQAVKKIINDAKCKAKDLIERATQTADNARILATGYDNLSYII
jgi:hypothetical protein